MDGGANTATTTTTTTTKSMHRTNRAEASSPADRPERHRALGARARCGKGKKTSQQGFSIFLRAVCFGRQPFPGHRRGILFRLAPRHAACLQPPPTNVAVGHAVVALVPCRAAPLSGLSQTGDCSSSCTGFPGGDGFGSLLFCVFLPLGACTHFWIRLQFCLDDIDRCRDPVGKCGAGSTRDKVSIVHGLQGLESRRRRRGPPGGHGRVDERPGGTSRCADRQGHRCHRERSFRDRGLSLSLFVLLFILPPPVLPMPAFCCACWRCVHFGFVVSLSCFVSSRLVSFRFVSSRFVSFRCQQNT
mmetsp:Transcript_14004/g.29309  ORF Transcript_14004/g.29309 Transcript_14004/m.29309 type:complete len:302 (+) Transcript_14004:1080-1985(+)